MLSIHAKNVLLACLQTMFRSHADNASLVLIAR